MIALALLWGLHSTFEVPQVVELPDLAARTLCFQAVVRTGELSAKDMAAAKVLASVLGNGTHVYTKLDLLQYATQVGDPIRCTLMPDHLRFGLTVPKGQLDLGAAVVSELLEDDLLDTDEIKTAIGEGPFLAPSYWSQALYPLKADYSRLKPQDVVDLYKKLFVPSNVVVAVSGPFVKNEATQALDTHLLDWKTPPKRFEKPPNLVVMPAPITQRKSAITSISLEGPEFASADDLPRQLLTAVCLGSGKWSSLFRVWREKNGWTYRQEAVIWPAGRGLRLRLMGSMKPQQNEPELAEKMRIALLDDVKNWTEDERTRAIGMLQAIFVRGIDASPLYFLPNRPLNQSTQDLTFLQAYWTMKFGRAFDLKKTLELAAQVNLSDLKAAATDMLAASQAQILSGGR